MGKGGGGPWGGPWGHAAVHGVQDHPCYTQHACSYDLTLGTPGIKVDQLLFCRLLYEVVRLSGGISG